MKNILFSFLFITAITVFSSCDDDGLGDGEWSAVIANNPGDRVDIGEVNGGLFNGNMEALNAIESNLPSGWEDQISGFNPPNNYGFFHSTDNAIDERAAHISGDNIDDVNEYGFLRQVIINPDIPSGALIRLRGKVRTQNLTGNGFNLFAIGYDATGQFVFGIDAISQTSRVRGTTDWQEYTTFVDGFPPIVSEIHVFLAIGENTTGDVYFDDIVLEID